MQFTKHTSIFYRLLKNLQPDSTFLNRQVMILHLEVQSSGFLVDLYNDPEYQKKFRMWDNAPTGSGTVFAMDVVNHIRAYLQTHDLDYQKFSQE